MNKIYDMKLHDYVEINYVLSAIRVPGGWIYNQFGYDGGKQVIRTSIFVPFNNEFQNK